jgi:hypothetical protein
MKLRWTGDTGRGTRNAEEEKACRGVGVPGKVPEACHREPTLCEAISTAPDFHDTPFTAFKNLSFAILTMDVQLLHLNVTITLSRITVNSFPPHGWGFFRRTVRPVEEEFGVIVCPISHIQFQFGFNLQRLSAEALCEGGSIFNVG